MFYLHIISGYKVLSTMFSCDDITLVYQRSSTGSGSNSNVGHVLRFLRGGVGAYQI